MTASTVVSSISAALAAKRVQPNGMPLIVVLTGHATTAATATSSKHRKAGLYSIEQLCYLMRSHSGTVSAACPRSFPG